MKSRKDAMRLEKKIGVISVLNFNKGYGFAVCPPEDTEYFFHSSDVVQEEGDDPEVDKFEMLNTGQRVEFTPLWSNKKQGWKGVGVRLVEEI